MTIWRMLDKGLGKGVGGYSLSLALARALFVIRRLPLPRKKKKKLWETVLTPAGSPWLNRNVPEILNT